MESSPIPLPAEVAGFAHAQAVAHQVATEVTARLEPGVTEREVVAELEAAARRRGARSWLHRPFVWFGERSGFVGFRSLRDFFPTDRRLQARDVITCDMAPVFDGYAADYGWSSCLDPSPAFDRMKAFDDSLRVRLLAFLEDRPSGRELLERTDREIRAAGYEVRHHEYPFGILGHRLERVRTWDRFSVGRPFELPTIALHLRQLARGIFPLLNRHDRQALRGVWAIQPHVGNGAFGVKFEDLLWVHEEGAVWLSPPEARGASASSPWHSRASR